MQAQEGTPQGDTGGITPFPLISPQVSPWNTERTQGGWGVGGERWAPAYWSQLTVPQDLTLIMQVGLKFNFSLLGWSLSVSCALVSVFISVCRRDGEDLRQRLEAHGESGPRH